MSTAVKTFAARAVTVAFGQLRALEAVDFDLHQGEILGLIGPNGAGKTTLTNVLTGYQRPTTGSVHFDGRVVTNWSSDRLARLGVARTFQAVRPFSGLTVHENVEAAASGIGMHRRSRLAFASELLRRVGLDVGRETLARDLSHGDERRLGVARALATKPSFLLLDEPAAGLNEHESSELVQVLASVPAEYECGLMVIEHDMRVIMQLCERIQVLDHGKTIACGSPVEIQRDQAVVEAYLGAPSEASQ